MTNKIKLLGGTGKPGNGKSTFLSLVAIALNAHESGGRIALAETSGIFGWGMSLHGQLGNRVRACKPLMKIGKYVPDDVTLDLFDRWYQVHVHGTKIETLLLPGCPRTRRQRGHMKQKFSAMGIVEIDVDSDEAFQSVNGRLKSSGNQAREDDAGGLDVFSNRLEAYENDTCPMLSDCNGGIIEKVMVLFE